MTTMFKESQLIQFVKYFPHPRLHLHLHLRLHLRLRPGDLGIILEAIEASEAWENYQEFTKEEQAQIPNVYVVHWQKENQQLLVIENEIGVI